MRMNAQNVITTLLSAQYPSYVLLAHSDAVWGIAYTEDDTVFSISADGSIKHWGPSGQPASPNTDLPSPHTLGLVSLSSSRDGQRVLYNSIEGLTSLWDVPESKVLARFESYVRKTENPEPCKSIRIVILKLYFNLLSMVRFVKSHVRNVRLNRWIG